MSHVVALEARQGGTGPLGCVIWYIATLRVEPRFQMSSQLIYRCRSGEESFEKELFKGPGAGKFTIEIKI